MTAQLTLGEMVSRNPAASRVFMRHDLDYCCGGKRTLEQACQESGLDPQALEVEIAKETPEDTNEIVRWDEAPLHALIDHIVARYHVSLREELPRLVAMAAKVAQVHLTKDPDRLPALHATLVDMEADLMSHMAKEEQVLFPLINAGQGAMAGGPVRVMHMEHEAAAEFLARIRDLTDTFKPHPKACDTWRALLVSLNQLDTDLRQHIHLENNILFPRALQG